MANKPRVAFFDFACCEGCQLSIINLEERVAELVEIVDVVTFREAMTEKTDDYDIAFIEGSITRPQDEERVKKIRENAKILIALGACATTAGVNALKNLQDYDEVRKKVYGEDWDQPHLNTEKAKPVHEVVKVDYKIHGCPINKEEFIKIVTALAMGKEPKIPDYPVCVECKRNGNVCVYEYGQTCLGPITRAGCDANCPTTGDSGCEGCRGWISHPNKDAAFDVLEKYGLTVEDIKESFHIFCTNIEQDKGERNEE